MLKLTHGSGSDGRVSTRNPRTRALAGAFIEMAFRASAPVRGAFDYWQLRAQEAKHGTAGADFSERFRHAETLRADWNFGGSGSMQRARVGLTGLPCRSNSV